MLLVGTPFYVPRYTQTVQSKFHDDRLSLNVHRPVDVRTTSARVALQNLIDATLDPTITRHRVDYPKGSRRPDGHPDAGPEADPGAGPDGELCGEPPPVEHHHADLRHHQARIAAGRRPFLEKTNWW